MHSTNKKKNTLNSCFKNEGNMLCGAWITSFGALPYPSPLPLLTAITLTKVVFPEYCSPTRVSSISSFQNRLLNQSRIRLMRANILPRSVSPSAGSQGKATKKRGPFFRTDSSQVKKKSKIEKLVFCLRQANRTKPLGPVTASRRERSWAPRNRRDRAGERWWKIEITATRLRFSWLFFLLSSDYDGDQHFFLFLPDTITFLCGHWQRRWRL